MYYPECVSDKKISIHVQMSVDYSAECIYSAMLNCCIEIPFNMIFFDLFDPEDITLMVLPMSS